MSSLIRFLSVINMAQLTAFRWGSMFLVLSIAVIVSASVFFRYVLNDSLSWSEELAKYAMLWLVFLGSPIALRLGKGLSAWFFTLRVFGVCACWSCLSFSWMPQLWAGWLILRSQS